MLDHCQATSTTAADAIAGLVAPRKTLPARLFYDQIGCDLFGQITQLPEYYVTRAETALLTEIACAFDVPEQSALIEYGASDESKAAIVLGAIHAAAYVPIDVAQDALNALVERMRTTHLWLPVYPLAADFLQPVTLPSPIGAWPRVGFFPGSTIGNLDPAAAIDFLRQARQTLGAGATFIIGVDLRKDAAILVPAYADSQGVTAAFNLNILARLNRELGADFDLGQFRHLAAWNEVEGRMEMHLVSQARQTAHLCGVAVHFEPGETIHTENSYKHTVEGFQALAQSAGWQPSRVWTDAQALVSVHRLRSVA